MYQAAAQQPNARNDQQDGEQGDGARLVRHTTTGMAISIPSGETQGGTTRPHPALQRLPAAVQRSAFYLSLVRNAEAAPTLATLSQRFTGITGTGEELVDRTTGGVDVSTSACANQGAGGVTTAPGSPETPPTPPSLSKHFGALLSLGNVDPSGAPQIACAI